MLKLSGGRHWFSKELVGLALTVVLSVFCILDEEPVWDFTDWNLLHIALLVVSLLVVFSENNVRARFGQFLYKDQATLVALFTFWLGLENYARVVFTVFFLHALTPLEIELLELVSVYASMGAWFTTELLPCFLFFFLAYTLVALANLLLTANQRLAHLMTIGVLLVLLYALVFSLWDFLFSSFSAISAWSSTEVFYLQPKTSLTYDRGVGLTDQFEWHRERTWPAVLHMEDLYFFFFQLVLVWALVYTLIYLAYLLVSKQQGLALSYTQLSVVALFLEHIATLYLFIFLNILVTSLRLWAATPGEFTLFW